MMSRKLHIILMVYISAAAVCEGLVAYTGTRLCNSSSDCPPYHCCRDRRNNLVGGDMFGNLLQTGSGISAGTCSMAPSIPGQECTNRCGCTYGHVCYSTIQGACCPKTTCWTSQAAAADRKYWQNCMRDPNCHLPPMVNPGPTISLS